MRLSLRTTSAWWLGAAAVLVGVVVGFDAPRALPQTPAKKQPVPDQAARDQALAKIQKQLQEAYSKYQTDPKVKADAANFLFKQAGQSKIPGEQYEYLQQAGQLAGQVGDLTTANWAYDELEELFQIDVLPQRAEALQAALPTIKSPEAAVDLVDQTLKLMMEAVNRDNYDLAQTLGGLAEDAARKSKDLPLVLSVQRERKWLTEAKQEFATLKPYLDRLQKDPTDAEANLHMGKYYALLKGDWDRGLFLLAQGNDMQLRLLAQRDLIKPEAAPDQVEVGDAWWLLADKYSGQIKVHIKQRAVFWYQQALYGSGPLQAKLEERIAMVPAGGQYSAPWDYSGPPGELKIVGKHFGNIFAVAFSADGKFVASGGSDSQAIIWDVQTGNKVRSLVGHGSTVWGVGFDPKGKYLYTSSWDGTARKWEISTGKDVQRFPPNNSFGSMYGLAVSPNGKHLLTASSDSTVRVWDTKTGNQIHALTGHNGPVYGVTFFADGKKALSAGSFDHKLIVWDLEKGKSIQTINNPGSSGRYVSVSPDGTKVVASGESVIRMWDLRNGQEIRQFKGHNSIVYAVAFSPNGKRLASGGLDATLRYWDVNSGQELQVFKGHNSTVYALAFSPGGGRIVSGGLDNTIRLWGLPR
jgi:Tol biopolymer transport system component